MAGVLLSTAATSLLATETSDVVRGGEIDTQPIGEALALFARQTGLHVMYVSTVVRNQRSHAVPAGLTPEDALRTLLEGTDLQFEFLTAHSVRIFPVASGPPAPDSATPEAPDLDEVIVTGSRIPVSPEVAATGPVQTITADEVQLGGSRDAVDIISALPQMTTSSGADSGNHSSPAANAGGITTADLRGLGPQRTLVLVNGRRLGPGDPNTANLNPAPDLDEIPVAMIDRVEVLTGGASATYGPDAIAGVVNFILKEDVQGVQVDSQFGADEHHQHDGFVEQLEREAGFTVPTGTQIDGMRRDVSVLAGTAFDSGAGQLTGYFNYDSQDPVQGSARDFTACPLISLNQDTGIPGDNTLLCQGSTSSSNFFLPVAGAQNAYSVVGNRFVAFPAAGAVPPSYFNFADGYYSQRADERYLAGFLGHLELNPAMRPFAEFNFMDDRTREALSPSGLFYANNTLTADGSYAINCSNPFLSSQEATILCTPAQIAADRQQPGSESASVWIGRRNIEGGDREVSFEHRNYRAVAGIDGALGRAWRYELYGLWHSTSLLQNYDNELSNTAISQALQVTTGSAGQPVCISGGRCVPYDIFGTGTVTAQQVAWLEKPASDEGNITEQIIEGSLTGELSNLGLVLPWAHEGLGLNIGFQHRSESLRFSPDAVEQSNDLSDFTLSAVPLNRGVSITEGYIEMRAPLAQDTAFARQLSAGAGYRFSDYSTAGVTNTWKFDVEYAPVQDLALRASVDRAVREPSLIELYTPLAFGYSGSVPQDPCAPTAGQHAAASLAECLHTGLTAAQYGDGIARADGGTSSVPQCVEGCAIFTGGNPALQAESAETWSEGFQLTPRAIEGASVSLDYFHIDLRGEIGSIPEAVTMQQCLATGDPVLCKQIVRAPDGSLTGSTLSGGGYILANAVNTGSALVSGIDVLLDYRMNLPAAWGSLALKVNGNWLQHHEETPYRSAPGYDCAGLFGNTCLNGSVNPKWRHNLRLTWELPGGPQLSAQWRFIGRTEFDNNSSQPLLDNQEEGAYDPVIGHIASYSYLDLAMRWQVSRNIQWRVGITNLFDRDPPLIPGEVSYQAGQLNTFAVYDLLGRNVYLALRANL
jgi:outer membrane receptor protein involved in Fe transport